MPLANEHKILLFDKALHDRSAFSCGIQVIDNWLQNSVSDQIKQDRIKLYCATDRSGKLVGFYGLNAHSIRPESAGSLARKGERHEIPVIYLPCIAVDVGHQGQDIGTVLMAHAIIKSVEVADTLGAAALVLDIKEDCDLERRTRFYEKLGFKPLSNTNPRRVFLSIAVARISVEKLKSAQVTSAAEASAS